jgi:hypothetical protein
MTPRNYFSWSSQRLDFFAFFFADVAAAQGGQHQRLAGAGKGLLDQVFQQAGLHQVLLLRRRIDVGALAFVALEQALGVHHLQQAQHGGVVHVRPGFQRGGMHLLGRRCAQREQQAQHLQFGSGRFGVASGLSWLVE